MQLNPRPHLRRWTSRQMVDGNALKGVERDLASRSGEDESGGVPLLLAYASDFMVGGVVTVDSGADLDEDAAPAREQCIADAGLAALGRGVTVGGRPPAFPRRQIHA